MRAKAAEFKGAAIDLSDGFIHFSTADQATETAARHFAGQDGLLLVAVDGGKLGEALVYEASRGGALFPHLYAAAPASMPCMWEKPLPLGADGTHVFPELDAMIGAFQSLARARPVPASIRRRRTAFRSRR